MRFTVILRYGFWALLGGAILSLAAIPASARVINTTQKAEKADPALLPSDGGNELPLLYLTPDKTLILKLDQDAASVIVGNPAHASVLMDTPRVLVVIPGMPGATSFTVLNKAGESILERDVIVSGNQKKYVRITKMCGSDTTCAANTVYYCPDGCYEVSLKKGAPRVSAPATAGGMSASAVQESLDATTPVEE